jgi:hypothetical protein
MSTPRPWLDNARLRRDPAESRRAANVWFGAAKPENKQSPFHPSRKLKLRHCLGVLFGASRHRRMRCAGHPVQVPGGGDARLRGHDE